MFVFRLDAVNENPPLPHSGACRRGGETPPYPTRRIK
jgi:hypothetical protein